MHTYMRRYVRMYVRTYIPHTYSIQPTEVLFEREKKNTSSHKYDSSSLFPTQGTFHFMPEEYRENEVE